MPKKEKVTKLDPIFQNMPVDVTYEIFSYLPATTVRLISKRGSNIANESIAKKLMVKEDPAGVFDVHDLMQLENPLAGLHPQEITQLLSTSKDITKLDPIMLCRALQYWSDVHTNALNAYINSIGESTAKEKNMYKIARYRASDNYINIKICIISILISVVRNIDENIFKHYLALLSERLEANHLPTIFHLLDPKGFELKSSAIRCDRDQFVSLLKRLFQANLELRYTNAITHQDKKKNHNLFARYLNLSGIDISFFEFLGLKLENANLCGANLKGIIIPSAKLLNTNLLQTNLENANLKNASLSDYKNINLLETIIIHNDITTLSMFFLPTLINNNTLDINKNDALKNCLNTFCDAQIVPLDKKAYSYEIKRLRLALVSFVLAKLEVLNFDHKKEFILQLKQSNLCESLFKHKTIKKFQLRFHGELQCTYDKKCIDLVEAFEEEHGLKEKFKKRI